MTKEVLSLEEIKKNRKPIRNANIAHLEKLSTLDVFAMWVTSRVGTTGFFLLIFFWTVIWFGWNIFAPKELQFDPFPAFVLWLFISNMIQILLMPLLLIGQNLQARHAESRAEADFEVNAKAEREVEIILTHLENQNEVMKDILNKLDK